MRHGFQYDTPYPATGPNGEYLLKCEPTPTEVVANQVREAIAHDREGKIRAALIALGWTPPHEPLP